MGPRIGKPGNRLVIVLLFLANYSWKVQGRMFLSPGLFLPPQIACPAGQILTTVPEQACTSPYSCQIVNSKRCVPRGFQVSQAPYPQPLYVQPQPVMPQVPPQYAQPQGSDVLSGRSWTSPPKTPEAPVTPQWTTTPTPTTTLPQELPPHPEPSAPAAFSYQPNLQPPSVPMEKVQTPVLAVIDSGNRTCKTVYEKVCSEDQTPKCQVLPKSSCLPLNETSVISEPKTPGCTVQYLKACPGNSTQPCSVVPQKVCLDGTKTADSDALKHVLAKGMDYNKTTTQRPPQELKLPNPTTNLKEVYPSGSNYTTTEGSTRKESLPADKKSEETTYRPGKKEEGGSKEETLKKVAAKEEGSLMECPSNLSGYDCVASTQNLCRRIESPMCGPQTFEKCTVAPINETSKVCNPVLKKICKLVASKPDSLVKAPISPQKYGEPSNQMNQRPNDSVSFDDEVAEVLVDERSKRDTGDAEKLERNDQERSLRKNYVDHFGPSIGGEHRVGHKKTQPDKYKRRVARSTEEEGEEVSEVLEERKSGGYEDSSAKVSKNLSKRDVSSSTRTVTTCVQKQVSVCSTNFTTVPKSGFKMSCTEVPSFSCKEIKVQGSYGSSLAENCTQYRRQICNSFKSLEFSPFPQTYCQNVSVPDCYDEIFDYSNTVIDKIQKPSTSVVKCEEVEDQVCGLQSSVELVVDECFNEERSSCQSGYTDKCLDIKKLKCKSKTTNEELSCQSI